MNGRWFFVDGRLTELHGSHEDVVEQQRELRADGHTVKAARTQKTLTSREIAAHQHQRRRR